jgi:hypothetical protein
MLLLLIVLENNWGWIFDGENGGPPITCYAGRWLNRTDSVNQPLLFSDHLLWPIKWWLSAFENCHPSSSTQLPESECSFWYDYPEIKRNTSKSTTFFIPCIMSGNAYTVVWKSWIVSAMMMTSFNTLRTGDADLRLYAYKQFKYPVPSVLKCCHWIWPYSESVTGSRAYPGLQIK